MFNGGMLVDLTDVQEDGLAPKGDYVVTVSDAEVKETRSKTGTYLQVDLEIMKGEYRGTKVTDRFNLTNANPTAVRIGHQTLKKLMVAGGKTDFVLRSPQDLCGLRVLASVDIRKSDQFHDSNEVKKYSGLSKDSSVFVSTLSGPTDQNDLPF
jgi:hypothetical protein